MWRAAAPRKTPSKEANRGWKYQIGARIVESDLGPTVLEIFHQWRWFLKKRLIAGLREIL